MEGGEGWRNGGKSDGEVVRWKWLKDRNNKTARWLSTVRVVGRMARVVGWGKGEN